MFRDLRIETERLILRPFGADDLDDLHAMLSDPKVVEHLPNEVMSRQETEEALGRIGGSYEFASVSEMRRCSLAVVLRETGRVVGWCGVGRLNIDPGEFEIYYGLASDCWGRGIATESAKALVDHAFRALSLERIVGIVYPENVASAKVLEKIGLTYRWQITGLPEEHAAFEGVRYFDMTRDEHNEETGEAAAR